MAQHKTGNVLAVTALAGLAGASIALLLAPRSGRETREQLQKSADDIKRQADDRVEQAKSKIRHNANKLKAWKEQMAQKGSDTTAEIGERLQDNATENPSHTAI